MKYYTSHIQMSKVSENANKSKNNDQMKQFYKLNI